MCSSVSFSEVIARLITGFLDYSSFSIFRECSLNLYQVTS